MKPFDRRIRVFAATAALFAASLVLATAFADTPAPASAPHIDVKLTQSKVVSAAGDQETLTEAISSKPGDTLQYTARYTNSGKAAAHSVMASLPVPDGMRFTGWVTPKGTYLASLDGKKFELAPLHRQITGADGKTQTVEVPLSEYRMLRWPLGTLAPGDHRDVAARVQLNPTLAQKP